MARAKGKWLDWVIIDVHCPNVSAPAMKHRKGWQPPRLHELAGCMPCTKPALSTRRSLVRTGANCPCLLHQEVEEQAHPKRCPQTGQGHGAASTDRFAEGQEDLAPEDVEEVGRSRAVHNDPVALIELAHVKVIQFLPRRAQFRGFQETQGASWPRSSSSGEKSGTQPSLPPSSPPLERLWRGCSSVLLILGQPLLGPPLATSALNCAAAPGVVEVQPGHQVQPLSPHPPSCSASPGHPTPPATPDPTAAPC